MSACRDMQERLRQLAALSSDELPQDAQEHLAACPVCRRELAAARLTRHLMTAAAEGMEPPPGFPERVAAAIAREAQRVPAEAEEWRLGWGLVPVFAAMTLALFMMVQNSTVPAPSGLVNTEGLSTSEQLVLEQSSARPDLILTAVMEDEGR